MICFRRYRCYLALILASLSITVILQYNHLTLPLEPDQFNSLSTRWQSINLSQIIRPDEDTAFITPQVSAHTCKTMKRANEHPHLIIMVASAPANRDARQAIRETWADKSILPSKTSVLFILGRLQGENITKSIYEEARTHRDIILEDFEDSYENLTLKTLFGLKWVKKNCEGATHMLKTDDDMLILVDNLLDMLTDINLKKNEERQRVRMDPSVEYFKPNHNATAYFKHLTSTQHSLLESDSVTTRKISTSGAYVLGYLYQDPKPIRDKNSKWFLPYELYSKDFFPDFISGTAYVIAFGNETRGTMRSILRNSLLVKPALPLEDVFITGIIANQAMEMPLLKGNEQFHKAIPPILPWSVNELATCFHYNSISIHGLEPKEIIEGWKTIREMNEVDCNSIKGRFYTSLYRIIWAIIS